MAFPGAGPAVDRELVGRSGWRPDHHWMVAPGAGFRTCAWCGGRWQMGPEPKSCASTPPVSTDAAAAAAFGEFLGRLGLAVDAADPAQFARELHERLVGA